MPRGQGDIHVMYIQIYVIIVCRVNHSAFHHVGCRTDRQFFLAVSWVRFEVPQMPNRTIFSIFSSHLTPKHAWKMALVRGYCSRRNSIRKLCQHHSLLLPKGIQPRNPTGLCRNLTLASYDVTAQNDWGTENYFLPKAIPRRLVEHCVLHGAVFHNYDGGHAFVVVLRLVTTFRLPISHQEITCLTCRSLLN